MKLLIFIITLSLVLSSLGDCPYQILTDKSLGSDIASGYVTTDARTCWLSCCKKAGCGGAAFIKSWGGCYLMSTNAAKATPKSEAGTILYITGTTQVTYTTGECKRGLSYDYSSVEDIRALSNVFWFYNWNWKPNTQLTLPAGLIEYIPMIWGPTKYPDVNTVVNAILPGTKYLLGFNEPNFYEQANMSPLAAAQNWPNVEKIAQAHGLKIIGPAVNYCGGGCTETDPFKYLRDWISACNNLYPGKGCKYDIIGAHWYSCGGFYLYQYIENLKQFNKPIWLTEFDCPDAASEADQITYMKTALDYLDNEPAVERYCWFAGRADNVKNANLLGAKGQLTALGQVYNTYNLSPNGCSSRITTPPSTSSPPPTTPPPTTPPPTTPPPTNPPPTTPPPTNPPPTTPPPTTRSYVVQKDKTILGNNLEGSGVAAATADACWNLCTKNSACYAATWVTTYNNFCYLKDLNTIRNTGISDAAGSGIYLVIDSLYAPKATANTVYLSNTTMEDPNSQDLPNVAYLGIGMTIGIVVVGLIAAIIFYKRT